jgi:hypothetical protein
LWNWIWLLSVSNTRPLITLLLVGLTALASEAEV